VNKGQIKLINEFSKYRSNTGITISSIKEILFITKKPLSFSYCQDNYGHCYSSGNPDPLVFHAPQVFFECLQQRISVGSKKKRLPNFTTGFVRKDALPLGTFTKYTWHITNLLHVKQIFDTPSVSRK